MYHVLLGVVAIDSAVLRWVQRLNLGSARQNTVKKWDMSAVSASFGSGEFICHMLTMWVAITFSSSCTQLGLGPTADLYVC